MLLFPVKRIVLLVFLVICSCLGFGQQIQHANFSVLKDRIEITYYLKFTGSTEPDLLYSLDVIQIHNGNRRKIKSLLSGDLWSVKASNWKQKIIKHYCREELEGTLQYEISINAVYKTNSINSIQPQPYYSSDLTPIKTVKYKKNSNANISGNKEIIPTPISPAKIKIDAISFRESTVSNNVLDADEKGIISFNISNEGNGVGYKIEIQTKQVTKIKGIYIDEIINYGNIQPNTNKIIEIPVYGLMELETGIAKFNISISEGNGFDPNPFEVSFQTQAFKEPRPAIADHKFQNRGGDILTLGDIAYLEVVIQNQGQGVAKDVKVDFSHPTNIYPAGETHFEYSRLKPNETKRITYDFFSNRRYTGDEIPIDVTISESYGKYGTSRTFTVPLNKRLEPIKTVSISGTIQEEVAIDQVYLTSDVDRDIPLVAKTYKHRYALIIGNEDYRKYQTRLQNDQNVAFARNDARTFKEYCQKTLGVQDDHIFLITDATKGMMSREIERVVKLAALDSQSELIFYYAGHGLPDQVSREGYLIPVDVTSSNLEDAISLKELYSKLASTNASKIYVFLDACFSGGGRGENGLLAARTVKVKPKGDIVKGNIIAFTASSGEEVSLPLNSESHGLFTYFILKKLKESKGEVSLGQLKNYLQEKVPRKSLIENGMGQTPQVLVSPDLSEEWANWRFQ